MTTKIKISRRKVTEDIELPATIPKLLRQLYISRGIHSADDLDRSIKKILPWKELTNIDNAANMLYRAMQKGIRIVIIGDFDVDGATSTALTLLCLRAFGCNNVIYLVPNRFKSGYGLTPEIVDQAKILGAQMILTVDNGISSHSGVDYANALGIPVLITDHHMPSDTLPAAEVILNPNLRDCDFQSKSLVGTGVAFYLMIALRSLLEKVGWFKLHRIVFPKLSEYLDLVALATITDMAPLDINNRILIWQGLNRIRVGKCRLGIKILLEISNRDLIHLDARDLGFFVGPLLNSAGRLDDMSIGIELLLSDNRKKARTLAQKLLSLNQKRKKIEQDMLIQALILYEKLEYNDNTLPLGLVVCHPEWHQGVIGILASRIKERFYRPTIAFAPDGKSLLKGSGRSIQGLNIYKLLERLDTLYPGLMIKFGGHAMAVGILLEKSKFQVFQHYFNNILINCIDPILLQNEVLSDGELAPEEITMETAQLLRNAGPWGPMFPEPLFDGQFHLLKQQIIGKCHLKVTVKPVDGNCLLEGIVFNIDTTVWPNSSVCDVQLVYKLNINVFRRSCSLQLIIDYIWPI